MSPVATEPKPRQWTRTAAQERLVREHLVEIDNEWSTADPRLLAELRSTEVMGSQEIMDFFGYTATTRVIQLNANARNWSEVDQLPHPSALPEADATFGRRGPREIRGVMRGRVVRWAIQTGRVRWDPFTKQLVLQTEIQFGGAPRR